MLSWLTDQIPSTRGVTRGVTGYGARRKVTKFCILTVAISNCSAFMDTKNAEIVWVGNEKLVHRIE